MRILLANPRGFCAGVDRAINIVQQALKIYGIPIYVRHEVVHNNYVVQTLRQNGVIFIEKISEVPDDSILIFSAHGVSQKVRAEAGKRNLTVFDATCPLVTKVHMEVARASHKGIETILIGHNGHPEVEGTMGQYNNSMGGIYLVESPEDVWKLQVKNVYNLYYVTQTTLSIEHTSNIIHALYQRFPAIIGPRKNDICYATINRQEAIRNLAIHSDIVLVIGSQNSSNSNRLAELAQQIGKPTHLINSHNDIQKIWLRSVNTIGITAGASTPDILVSQVIEHLISLGAETVEELLGNKEDLTFEIPKKLQVKVNMVK